MGGTQALIVSSIAGSLLGTAKKAKKPSANTQHQEAEKQQREREAKDRRRNREKVLEARNLEKKRNDPVLGGKTTLSSGAASLTEDPKVSTATLKNKLGA